MENVRRSAYSSKEIAAALGISSATLYRLWQHGKGPQFFHIGRRRLISAEAMEAWCRHLEAEAGKEAA